MRMRLDDVSVEARQSNFFLLRTQSFEITEYIQHGKWRAADGEGVFRHAEKGLSSSHYSFGRKKLAHTIPNSGNVQRL